MDNQGHFSITADEKEIVISQFSLIILKGSDFAIWIMIIKIIYINSNIHCVTTSSSKPSLFLEAQHIQIIHGPKMHN